MYLLLVYLLLGTTLVSGQNLTYLGSCSIQAAGFPALFDHGADVTDPTERYSILISTFILEEPAVESVYLLRYPGKCLDSPETCPVELVADGFTWPRQPGQIPESVFGSDSFVHIPDGFIPPGYRDGGLYIADRTDQSKVEIANAADDPNWFYQSAIWKDADGDGLMDVFTCRTRNPLVPPSYVTEFLWYRNPGGPDAPRTGPWEIGHVIMEDDCDTFFVETNLTVEDVTYNVFFSTAYFQNKLTVHWNAQGLWDNSTQINSRVIGTLIEDIDCVPGEGLCGHFFDLMLDDFNLDGRLDLLVTINSEIYGHLVVYEIPDDFRTNNFEPIIIEEGFVPRLGNPNEGAPGLLQSFLPTPDYTGKPWLGLTGDDDGKCYYLYPESQDPDSWDYEMVPFYDAGEGFTMGGPLVFDANGDGYAEFFQLLYTTGEVQFYTFKEEMD